MIVNSLAFDIGANTGGSAHYLLSKYEKVVCFEPNPNLTNCLINAFKNRNIEIVQKGLSSKNEIKTFHISDISELCTFSNDWITKSRFAANKWSNAVEVETITLDTAINTYGIPNFIKIDVEGHEYEVLSSLTKLLDNTLIGFEWTEELFESVERSIRHVQNLGYKNFAYTNGDNLEAINGLSFTKWENLDIFKNIVLNRKQAWGMIYFKV